MGYTVKIFVFLLFVFRNIHTTYQDSEDNHANIRSSRFESLDELSNIRGLRFESSVLEFGDILKKYFIDTSLNSEEAERHLKQNWKLSDNSLKGSFTQVLTMIQDIFLIQVSDQIKCVQFAQIMLRDHENQNERRMWKL